MCSVPCAGGDGGAYDGYGTVTVAGAAVVVRVRLDDGAEKQTQQLRLQLRQTQQHGTSSRGDAGGIVIPLGRRMM